MHTRTTLPCPVCGTPMIRVTSHEQCPQCGFILPCCDGDAVVCHPLNDGEADPDASSRQRANPQNRDSQDSPN